MESAAEILRRIYADKSPMNTGTSSSADQLPDEAGAGKPGCPECGGLGFVVLDVPPTHPAFGRAVPCDCRAEEREVQRLNKLLRLSQLGALENCTFDAFLPEGHGLREKELFNLRLAYDRALAYARNPQGWLVFKGGYGCGKTHLAAAIANYQVVLGHAVLFINTPDLLDHLRAAYSPFAETSYDTRFEEIRSAPLLILDDLGTQSNTDWAQEKLYQIFNYRYNNRLPTIVTTNEELEAIDIRVRSRLVDPSLSQVIHILAPDFRLAGADHNQSDLSSLDLHADKTFDSFNLQREGLTRAEANNLRKAHALAQRYAQKPQDWLVFYSIAYGNGKTHLAAAIANYTRRLGRPVLFIVVPDLLDHLRATFNPASQVRLDKRFHEVKTAELLVLDDLGTESATGWVREKLYQLFNYRYSARLPTVITTSKHLDEIDPKLAARLLDKSRCTIFSLEVPRYAGNGKQ